VVDVIGTGNIPTRPASEPFSALPLREALTTATKFPVRLKNTVFEGEYKLMMGITSKFEEIDASVTEPLREQPMCDAPLTQMGDERAGPAQLPPPKEHCTDTHDPVNLQFAPSLLHEMEHERLVPDKRLAGLVLSLSLYEMIGNNAQL